MVLNAVITDEMKVAAFDALVAMLKGKETFVRMHRIMPTWYLNADGMTITARDVPVYEWKLYAMDSKDIKKALLALAPQNTSGGQDGT